MNFLSMLKKIPHWLYLLLAVIVVLRVPTLFDPYAYGDEMIYLTLGNAVRQGVTLYSQVHDNKPPLLYLTAALSGNLFWFRLILGIWMLATTVLFWRLAKRLFPKNNSLQVVSTWVFGLLTTIPLFEGNIANSELFMTGLSIAAFWILLGKKLYTKKLLLSGFLFGLSALFKIPGAFELPVIFVYWFITGIAAKNFNLGEFIKKCLFVSIGFILPIALSFVWYFFKGAFSEYLIAAFAQNVGYLSSFRPDDVREPFLVRNAPLLMRAAITAVGTFILFLLRNRLSKQFLLLAIWLLFTLFAATLSERPYPHYLVQVLPAVSLFVGMLVEGKNKEQVYTIIPLALFALVPVYYKFWFYQSAPYYSNFISYAIGEKTKKEYYTWFNNLTNAKYEISEYIRQNTEPSERIFVWGDVATVYALSRRLPPFKYVADYHVYDFYSKEKVIEELKEEPPSYIVIFPDATEFDSLEEFISQNSYTLEKIVDGSEVWSSD